MQVLAFDGKAVSTVAEFSVDYSLDDYRAVNQLGDSISIVADTASRAIEFAELSIIGSVSAGVPIEAISQYDNTAPVPMNLFKEKPTYLLRVRGDSMKDAGIIDGDLIAIKKTDRASAGDFIVARMGNEVTLKELRVEKGRPVLVPHNKKYTPMFVAAEDFVVEGVFVGLLRSSLLH